jgi:hypothetical protein
LSKPRITLPVTQIYGRNPVEERGVKQAGGGVDEGGDSEELATDNGIGLTSGLHPIHQPASNAH